MGILGGAAKFMFYTPLRAVEQAKESTGRFKDNLKALREARQRRALALDEEIAQAKAMGVGHVQASEKELEDPTQINNPARRFAVLQSVQRLTEAELAERARSVRVAKRIALLAMGVSAGGSFACLFLVPVWALLLVAPLFLTGSSLLLVMALRYGLYQSQIEKRSLHSLKTYMARPDLLRHLFS